LKSTDKHAIRSELSAYSALERERRLTRPYLVRLARFTREDQAYVLCAFNLVPRDFSLAWGRGGKRPWDRLVT